MATELSTVPLQALMAELAARAERANTALKKHGIEGGLDGLE